jgi:hypothetical protein
VVRVALAFVTVAALLNVWMGVQLLRTELVALGVSLLAVAFVIMFGSYPMQKEWAIDSRFRRICKALESKGLGEPRNRMLTWALLSLRENGPPMRLADAMRANPILFGEDVLLRYAYHFPRSD